MLRIIFVALLLGTASQAFAQNAPFTDWRARIDGDFSKIAMPRDAHVAVMQILQQYEREAQMQKAQDAAKVPDKKD